MNDEGHLIRDRNAKLHLGKTGVNNAESTASDHFCNTGVIPKSGPKMTVDIVDLEMAEKIDANIENIRVRVESLAKTIK